MQDSIELMMARLLIERFSVINVENGHLFVNLQARNRLATSAPSGHNPS